MTYSERFVRDSVTFVPDKAGNPRWAHLKLPNARRQDLDNPNGIYQPSARVNCATNVQERYIDVVLRVRYANALKSCGDNIPRLFIILNQVFLEDTIKHYFNKVWVSWHNVMQRKENNRQKAVTQQFDHEIAHELGRRTSIRGLARDQRDLRS